MDGTDGTENDLRSRKGLSSIQALETLHEEIQNELSCCTCRSHGIPGLFFWLTDSYSHASVSSTFRWPSIILSLICSSIFIIAYRTAGDAIYLIQGILILIVTVFNVAIVGYDIRSYHKELHEKARILSETIKESIIESNVIAELEAWTSGKFYPQLHLPHSPCISLQWTLRDGNLVNVPTPLIVKGDIIQLCPGAPAPGRCRILRETSESGDEGTKSNTEATIELSAGEQFVPTADCVPQEFTGARLRKAVRPSSFEMLETPYLSWLRLSFEKSWTRPRSLYDKERHTIIANYIEKIITPLVLITVVVSSIIHYGHFHVTNSFEHQKKDVIQILMRIALVIIPLIPFALPSSWIILNAFGIANLLHASPGRDEASALLNSTVDRLEKQNSKGDYFDDIDTEIGSDVNETMSQTTAVNCNELYQRVIQLITNRSGCLWRSANLLHALGSMTALCCVDKKGILSWPNPTADKIFFLTSPSSSSLMKKKNSNASDLGSGSKISDSSEVPNINDATPDAEIKIRRRRTDRKSRNISRAEVLDVTHDPHSALSLQFDDTNWSRFLSNLKPLGLGILLNTCNPDIQAEYTRFCDHISCESLHNEAAVPVVNKRCLCELSRQIGFTSDAVKDYEYLFLVAMFRHVRPEIIHHGKLLNSLNIPRLKMPFPHLAAAVIKEKLSNTYQLFSQGTGDLVLDACTEYWDGSDLRNLTDIDRKRILDFYHRSSLTAYCMAFSYVPLTTCPDAKITKDNYLELAPDSSHVFPIIKNVGDTSSLRWSDTSERGTGAQSRLSGHYLSTDSLTVRQEGTHHKTSASSSPSSESIESHLEAITTQMNNEVFIGMVTMQYQACPDFVQLVEQLEKACIRFVHFSKENELRSRVFSEKMGLEAGWNCHISLHSDSEKSHEGPVTCSTNISNSFLRSSKISLNEGNPLGNHPILRSQSAPCAVNLDQSVVKFVEGETVVNLPEKEAVNISSSDSGGDLSTDEEDQAGSKSKRTLSNISPSPSRVTESTATDTATAPIAFDVLNRAKLPKGIENIRPHLEFVDNVPLLVSLFTDCTPETTCEMISIMQEYGEVVCVLGSSANMCNMSTFLQADVSIGIEPLYPEVCVTQSVIEGDSRLMSKLSESFMSPTQIAKQLISLPSSLSLHRQDPLSLHRLIMEARNFMNNTRNSLQFLLCCCLSLSLVQLLSSVLMLPPLLTSGHVLWLVFFVLPILSFSLMGTPLDPHVMTAATGKNLNLGRESVVYFLLCYLMKFSPSMLVIVGCYAWLLNYFCQKSQLSTDIFGTCWMFMTDSPSVDAESHLLFSQTFVMFLLVLYLIIISMGFVNRTQLVWQRTPLSNKWWLITSTLIILAQLIFFLCEMYFYVPIRSTEIFIWIPVPIAITAFIWPLVLIPLNTLVKRNEIKANNRQQRRARLEFNTKLGMNSPF